MTNARRPLFTAASVAEFVENIGRVPDQSPSFYVYRGERDYDWKVAPGLMRAGRERLLSYERDALRELIAVHPKEFSEDQTMFDRLVRMQHFNLPSRLIDVTSNPLVALYFATDVADTRLFPPTDGRVSLITVPQSRMKYFDSDTVSCIANLANLSELEKTQMGGILDLPMEAFNRMPPVDRLLQFVRTEKPYFLAKIRSNDLQRMWYVLPKLSNRRIIAQNGAFLIVGLNMGLTEVEKPDNIQFNFIEVPHGAKIDIRKQLDVLGINQSSLFPEISHAADYIVARYR